MRIEVEFSEAGVFTIQLMHGYEYWSADPVTSSHRCNRVKKQEVSCVSNIV